MGLKTIFNLKSSTLNRLICKSKYFLLAPEVWVLIILEHERVHETNNLVDSEQTINTNWVQRRLRPNERIEIL